MVQRNGNSENLLSSTRNKFSLPGVFIRATPDTSSFEESYRGWNNAPSSSVLIRATPDTAIRMSLLQRDIREWNNIPLPGVLINAVHDTSFSERGIGDGINPQSTAL
jgi:hypothetical protein